MLKKVMKYDIKYSFKTLVPIYIILLALTIVTMLLSWLANIFSLISILSSIMLACLIIIDVGVLFVTCFISVKRFYQEFVMDSGYLTNTLPVKKSTLILSKICTSIITIISSALVVIASVLAILWQNGLLKNIDIIFSNQHIMPFNISLMSLIGIICLILLFVYIMQISMFYLAISLGQLHNSNKLIWSAISWFISYFVYEIIALIILVIMALSFPDIMNTLNQIMPPINLLYTLIGSMLVLVTIFTICATIGTNYIISNKLNLE